MKTTSMQFDDDKSIERPVNKVVLLYREERKDDCE